MVFQTTAMKLRQQVARKSLPIHVYDEVGLRRTVYELLNLIGCDVCERCKNSCDWFADLLLIANKFRASDVIWQNRASPDLRHIPKRAGFARFCHKILGDKPHSTCGLTLSYLRIYKQYRFEIYTKVAPFILLFDEQIISFFENLELL